MRVAGVAGLGAIAAACAKKKVPVVSSSSLDALGAGSPPAYQLIPASTELLSGIPQRVAFVLVDPATGDRFLDGTIQLWYAKDRSTPATGPFVATYHGDGLGVKGVYETHITFPADGEYSALARPVLNPGSKANPGPSNIGQLTVGKATNMPAVGDKSPVVATPTFANARGVHPICTQRPKPCSMHDLSLDQALRNGKPTLVIIATPLFCQSALCGPEVKIVDSVRPEVRDTVNFVHIEVYRDEKPTTIQQQILSPAAVAFKLDQEPAMYFIDPSGTIVDRTLGPVDRADVRDALHTLSR